MRDRRVVCPPTHLRLSFRATETIVPTTTLPLLVSSGGNPSCLTTHPHCAFTTLLCSPVHAKHENTNEGVFLCSAHFLHFPMHAEHVNTSSLMCFIYSPMHAEHENTPTLVCFRVRHVFYALKCTPSMKPHPHWCVFMFGACCMPSNAMRRGFPLLVIVYINI